MDISVSEERVASFFRVGEWEVSMQSHIPQNRTLIVTDIKTSKLKILKSISE
jgi:hypothetical protein